MEFLKFFYLWLDTFNRDPTNQAVSSSGWEFILLDWCSECWVGMIWDWNPRPVHARQALYHPDVPALFLPVVWRHVVWLHCLWWLQNSPCSLSWLQTQCLPFLTSQEAGFAVLLLGSVKKGVSEGHILSAGSFHVVVEKVSSKQDWDLPRASAAVCGLLLRGTHACRKRLTLTDMLHQADCVIFLSHGSLHW